MRNEGDIALVFTDLEGSSQKCEELGRAFEPWRDAHFALLRQALRAFGGVEIETAGDSLFAAFDEATDAARFALAAQIAFDRFEWPSETGPIRVRIGVHVGDPHRGRDGDRLTLRGAPTNRAARVMSASHGGQIVFSSSARRAVKGLLEVEGAGGFWVSHGRHRLKGIGEDELFGLLHPLLRAEFPPLETLDPIRHNLPLVAPPLVGREALLEEWRRSLVEETRLLTLCAFGGLGKTRAALAIAESLVGDFRDGVWWVDASGAWSSHELWRQIALALRLEIRPGLELSELVPEFLESKTLLLCLDNLEQIPDADRVVSQILKCAPGVRLLATSRHALRLRNEKLALVPPLSVDEGTLLFVNRAQSAGANHIDQAQVRSLVAKLEGIPLAIILAAARARLLSPAQIESRLDDRFRMLSVRTADEPARQQTLSALIDWSFELLAPFEQDVLARLSVFRGGLTLEAFCALESEIFDEWDALQALDELVARSLVLRDPHSQRLSLFDSIALYAEQKLAQRESEGASALRHARYYCGWAQGCVAALRTPDEARLLAQLSLETRNIERALETTENGQTELGAQLALSLGIWQSRHGLALEAIRVFDSVLMNSVPTTLEIALRRERAGALLDISKLEEAKKEATRALELTERAVQTSEEARCRIVLGISHMESGQNDDARREFEAALSASEAAGDGEGLAIARHNLGTLALNARDLEAAASFWIPALEERRKRGDRRGLAETLCNLGVLAQESGDLERAALLTEEALEHEVALEHLTGTARALFNLGEVAELRLNFASAARFYAASARAFERAASPLWALVCQAKTRVEAHLPDSAVQTAPDVALPGLVAWAHGHKLLEN